MAEKTRKSNLLLITSYFREAVLVAISKRDACTKNRLFPTTILCLPIKSKIYSLLPIPQFLQENLYFPDWDNLKGIK